MSTSTLHARGDNPGCEERPRPLTVSELQQALRSLQGRRAPDLRGNTAPSRSAPGGDVPRPASPPPAQVDAEAGDVLVLAAHAGAGASTVSLAIADAAAAAGRAVHLIDDSQESRSGLVAAADAELGLDSSGGWRRGSRSGVTIDHRAGATVATPCPSVDGPGPYLTLVDVGLRSSKLPDGCTAVVVCRPTVPGVQQAERMLAELEGRPLVVASVGDRRWSPVVRASLGPRLRARHQAGSVVTVPVDRGLRVSGLTDRPLPWTVRAAGARLLELLDALPATHAGVHSTATAEALRQGISR